MAVTEFRYPDTSSPTHTWTSPKDPLVAGSLTDQDSGIAAQLAADNQTLHAEQLTNAYNKYTLHFSGINATQAAAYWTFLIAVRGAKFYFKDCGAASSSFIPVRFAKEGFRRQLQPENGGTYAFTAVLVDSPT